jgi:hypothetical protein
MTGRSKSVFMIGALLLASKIEGVPISGEVIYHSEAFEGNSLTLNGPNFSITSVPYLHYEEGGAYCFFGCPPDYAYRTQDGIGELIYLTSGTIDGTFYPGLSWGNGALGDEGYLFVSAGIDLPGNGSLTYTSSLTAAGHLVFFDLNDLSTCLICGLDFSARGRMFMTFEEMAFPFPEEDPRTWLWTTEMRYTFTSIPEPSTFALASIPLGFI